MPSDAQGWPREQKAALASTQRDELRRFIGLRCPKCGMELKEIAFRGVCRFDAASLRGTFLTRASWRSRRTRGRRNRQIDVRIS